MGEAIFGGSPATGEAGLTIWTIGHSTRPLAEFLELLAANRIEVLTDVRRFPGSRKYPHFHPDSLATSLPVAGVEYALLPELGGRRRPRPDSPNTAWRNESFRGYADYMETEGFGDGIGRLLELAQRRRTAIMCAEATWWRCHRALIADVLKAKGVAVLHIIGRNKAEPHPFTSAARMVDGRLSYAATE